MHLLATRPGGYSAGDGVVDLAQTPADVVILSAADTDLLLLASALDSAPADAPALRLASLLALRSNASVDLYVETVLRHAKLVIVSLIGGIVAPLTGTAEEFLRNTGIQETLRRLLPDTLYREASLTLLNPQVTSVSTPATIGEYEQAQQRIPSLLSLDQSFILVWPQVVALVALTVACFALAYVLFMRQEVRA